MNVVQICGSIEALSPITHFGDEKTGSTPLLRTQWMWCPAYGEHVQLPFISGNAIRGVMRRLLMHDFMDCIGIDQRSPKLHHALFTGGILEGTDDSGGTIDLRFRNQMREVIPPLGLMGTAVGNQMLPGCLTVEQALPVCEETAHFTGGLDEARAKHPVSTFTQNQFHTRRDDLRADRENDEQAMQMKIQFEAFCMGTLFAHGFVLRYASKLEASCLGHALRLWEEQPIIGGKTGTGHGRIRFDYSPWPDAQPYLVYLDAERERIVEAVQTLAERIEGKGGDDDAGKRGGKRSKRTAEAAATV